MNDFDLKHVPPEFVFWLNEQEQKKYRAWEKTIPRRLAKLKYTETFSFSGSSGIGVSSKVVRKYDNGAVAEIELTDYSSW